MIIQLWNLTLPYRRTNVKKSSTRACVSASGGHLTNVRTAQRLTDYRSRKSNWFTKTAYEKSISEMETSRVAFPVHRCSSVGRRANLLVNQHCDVCAVCGLETCACMVMYDVSRSKMTRCRQQRSAWTQTCNNRDLHNSWLSSCETS